MLVMSIGTSLPPYNNGEYMSIQGQEEFEKDKSVTYLMGLRSDSTKLLYPEYYPLNDLAKQYGLAAISYMRACGEQDRREYLQSDKCKMVSNYLSTMRS